MKKLPSQIRSGLSEAQRVQVEAWARAGSVKRRWFAFAAGLIAGGLAGAFFPPLGGFIAAGVGVAFFVVVGVLIWREPKT